MTRSDKLRWLCKVWATCPDYCRIAHHMFAGASPSDICLHERISQAKLRMVIVGSAHTIRAAQEYEDAWPQLRALRERES